MLRTAVFDNVDLTVVRRKQSSSLTEATIERATVALLKKTFARAELKKIDATVPGWRAWPDRIAMVPGVPMHWVEMKKPKGSKYEPGQERKHAELRGVYKQAVFIVLDRDSMIEYVSAVLYAHSARSGAEAFVDLSKHVSDQCTQRVLSSKHPSSFVSAGTSKAKTALRTKPRRI